jgi:glycosyltransferase involved in cell wall biosynthesis
MRRLRVLISAYACEPGTGSEPGVGWNWITELARFHDVWAVTRSLNRRAIEQSIAATPQPHVRWIYVDLPRWARRHGGRLAYYQWQFAAYRAVQRAHREVVFDLVHHLTFGMHWIPTLLIRRSVPLVWGPLGGGERAPASFRRTFPARGVAHELARDAARWIGERDPSVRLAVRRAALILATSNETATRLRDLGAREVELYSEVGLVAADVRRLNGLPFCDQSPYRLVSVGRLLHWKGIHLGLEAFARLHGVCEGGQGALSCAPLPGHRRRLTGNPLIGAAE